MEVGNGGGEEPPPPNGWKKKPPSEGGEKPAKRKMKTPYQLEILEKTYAVETYPPEALRAELSVKTGLSDRQLQMWFCHRRLKDRKIPPMKRQRREDSLPLTSSSPQNDIISLETGIVGLSPGGGLGSSGESRRAVSKAAADAARIGPHISVVERRYYDSPPPPTQPTKAERRILASVESQLGEPLREGGPVLGVQFDPLPPGAFGAPIEIPIQQNQPVRPYDSNIFDRRDAKSTKAAGFLSSMKHPLPSSSNGKKKLVAKDLHEYKFHSEQPGVCSRAYERVSRSHYYDSSIDTSNIKVASLPSGAKSFHGYDKELPNTFQGQISSLLSQQGRRKKCLSISMDPSGAPNSEPFLSSADDNQFGMSQVTKLENLCLSSGRILHDKESRLERKRRRSDEAKITKEVEVHEKGIRREFEKQDIMKRKREEQLRREMEKHDRERRKEKERMMREKQREEVRFQREQRREDKLREKSLLKESQKAEKLRQKEELRLEKEAAKQKAAIERATARQIAREYMELIEDERLELMELAAVNKGLPSVFAIDSNTLQQLDSFRSILCAFPPSSVTLRRPFDTQPWANCDENISKLLMVWKFFITFADILGLWPFTLDEFVQSLHDYDSRLLGEIHVAVLKLITKDIENVARSPAITTGCSQRIVEGAYAWGFNVHSWQCHLNYLTWPEILRQFALSAGLGPQVKTSNVEHIHLQDDNEHNDGENVISSLRNGSAVENAVALMQEKGYSHKRRSRHRLTPGTVKFAAFHVLSLEGSEGLTILEVADKIQKSGLRDLTTSKTPEASIAAALSRDTKLFERTAPSTYCVRSPYRKDPADADAVLSAARKKIQGSQSALSDSEEAVKIAENVDAERDEDSDGDAAVADGPEVDGVRIETKLEKNDPFESEFKDHGILTLLSKEKGGTIVTLRTSSDNSERVPPMTSENSKTVGTVAALHPCTNSNFLEAGSANMEEIQIDESNFGEPWIQGLSEGDYSELSVEERLNALAALMGVAIEGNSIRAALEERLESAGALKKQMWAEAQLDKRRSREEYSSRLQGSREGNQTLGNTDKANDDNSEAINKDQFLEQNLVNLGYIFTEKSRSQLKSLISHKAEQLYVYRSLPLGQDRRHNRYWQFSASSSPNDPGCGRIFFESRDGHWRLIDSEEAFDALLTALDTRGIRESHLHSMLQRIERTFKESLRKSKKATDSTISIGDHHAKTGMFKLTTSGNCRWELDCPSSTVNGHASDSDATENSMSFKIQLGSSEIEKNFALSRYQGFIRWMWKECYNPCALRAMRYGKKRCSELLHTCDSCFQSSLAEERHCPSCHKTFMKSQNSAFFSEHVGLCEQIRKSDPDWKVQLSHSTIPIGTRLLKAQLSIIEVGSPEVAIPAEALKDFWTEEYRKSWAAKLHSSSSSEELFQILTLLELAIKQEFLSPHFETTAELLSSTQGISSNIFYVNSGSVPVLPWVPDTSAAVALRLLDLDSSISYMLQRQMKSHKAKEGDYLKLSSRHAAVSMQEMEPMGTPDQINNQNEGRRLNYGSGHTSRGRGCRGRGQGRGRGRGLKMNGSSSKTNFTEILGIRKKSTGRETRRGRARGRGRRTFRPRRRSESEFPTIDRTSMLGRFITANNRSEQLATEESSQSSGEEQWAVAEARRTYVEDDDTVDCESSENCQVSGCKDDDQSEDSARNAYDDGKPMRLVDGEVDVEDGNMEEDEDGINSDGCSVDSDTDEDQEIRNNTDDAGDGCSVDSDTDEDQEIRNNTDDAGDGCSMDSDADEDEEIRNNTDDAGDEEENREDDGPTFSSEYSD